MAVLRYSHKPSNPQSDTTTQLISTINNTVSSIQSTLEKKVTKSSTRGLSENNYSTPEKNKLHDIEDGAEVNVQADWNETDTTSDSYILNKPNVPILDPSGLIPAAYLPSYVDDVLEYNSVVDFPAVGEKGKIYVDTSTDIAYRWSGSTYIEISKSIVTGVKGDAETDYRIGNINLTAANIGLSKVVNLDQSKAIKMITRSGTTFTYTCLDGTTGTFTLQDTVYSLPLAANGTRGGILLGFTQSGRNYPVQLSGEKAYVNVPWTDTNTWRGIQDNLTSSTNTTESLSAKQGYLLANGSARDNTKLPLAGGTMTGSITMSQSSSTRNVGIIGTYDPNRAAAIWSMGSSYQIKADGTAFGSLYGAAYAYFGPGYTFGAGYSNGHSLVWCLNGSIYAALGDSVWSRGGFKKNGSSDSYVLTGGGGHKAVSDFWPLFTDSYACLRPGSSNGWIQIGTSNTSYGILPSTSGSAGSGHNYIGTSSWYWKYAYIDQIYGYLNGSCSGSAGSVAWANVTGKPTIPTKTSQLTNDSGYIKASVVTGTCSKLKASTGSYFHYYISMSNADAKKIIYIRFWDSSGNSIDPQYHSTYSSLGVTLSNVWHHMRQVDLGTVTYKYSIEL